MEFQIDPASRTPIYRQLIEQIREAVARGRLSPEQKLPSVRELSRELLINPNTVVRAYAELEQDGAIVMRQGLGAFVAKPKDELTKKARKERLHESLDRFLTEAVHLGFTAEEATDLFRERIERYQWRKKKDEG